MSTVIVTPSGSYSDILLLFVLCLMSFPVACRSYKPKAFHSGKQSRDCYRKVRSITPISTTSPTSSSTIPYKVAKCNKRPIRKHSADRVADAKELEFSRRRTWETCGTNADRGKRECQTILSDSDRKITRISTCNKIELVYMVRYY